MFCSLLLLQSQLRMMSLKSFPCHRKKYLNLSSKPIQIQSQSMTLLGMKNIFLYTERNINIKSTSRDYGWPEDEVYRILLSLQQRGLIKSMEFNSFTRIHHEDKEIKVVKQMPTIASNKQPTIAIITAQYCEKIAVDSMLENKETFVRYTTVGELLKIAQS